MLIRIHFFILIIFITSKIFSQSVGSASIINNTSASNPEIQKKVDEYIRFEMEQQKIPGVSLAVIKNGEVVYAKGYGLANVEHMVPVIPETIFQSGSVGKAFTVMAVMMLADEGKITLNDSLTKYFADAPFEWNKITIRHVLEHTSGLMTGYPKDFDFRKDHTEDDLYKIYKEQPIAFKTGEKRGYSNVGFAVLGFLIRKVTGQFYGDYLKEKVFDPLDMSATRIISEEDLVPNRAAGYRLEKGVLKNQQWIAPSNNMEASGSLYTNVLDIAKWEAALNSGKLLKPASYTTMWKPVVTNNKEILPYGFSWQLTDIFGKNIVEHSGGWQGSILISPGTLNRKQPLSFLPIYAV
jgi:CubicO group peptidase (beta-lactamase class C family)